ncbi:MAG: RNA polymerase sigma factor [Chloroflexi bacterium]|nr:MAG: RNA polymerase sigma factor [Chloroflexota bacterium]
MMEDDLRRSAVERAYRDHVDHVYRVAYAIVRDQEAARDVTHDAFARAYERWEQYDANRSLVAWLHGIVANAALDAVRRRRVRERAVAGLGRAAVAAANPGSGDPASDHLRRRIVDAGLASLRPEARAAVVLRHYYGYDYAEIASFLRTSSGNVGSLLSRAHAELRRALAAEDAAAALDGAADDPADDPPDDPGDVRVAASGRPAGRSQR